MFVPGGTCSALRDSELTPGVSRATLLFALAFRYLSDSSCAIDTWVFNRPSVNVCARKRVPVVMSSSCIETRQTLSGYRV